MAKKNQHVVPLGNGWAVRKTSDRHATVITLKQRDAISYARHLAQQEHCELVIHRRDGKIRTRESYAANSKRVSKK